MNKNNVNYILCAKKKLVMNLDELLIPINLRLCMLKCLLQPLALPPTQMLLCRVLVY